MQSRLRLNKKRLLYTICFFLFCLIDQRIKTGSGLDGAIESFRNLSGVVMALLILSHYKLDDFKAHKIPYLVWSLICVIGGGFYIRKGQALAWFLNSRIVFCAALFLWGFVGIRLFTELVLEKRKIVLNRLFACAWLVMMGLMCVSRNEAHWPANYLVTFGCFYLTDYSEEELDDLFQGMLNGIISAFFILQGWCFVFRPYDQVRYVGIYNNSNLNCLFYLMVLAAVLAKVLYVHANHRPFWLKCYYWAGVGTLISFIFLTISRTGLLTMAVLVFFAILFLAKMTPDKNPILSMIKKGALVLLCAALLFPVVFGAVRYLPPAFHHPVWFFGEWSESKVHSWDPWDSEKFIDIDEFLQTSSRRISAILLNKMDNGSDKSGTTSNRVQYVVEGENKTFGEGEKIVYISALQGQLYEEALAQGYAVEPSQRQNATLVRKSIYKFFIHMLNFSGHMDSEMGFQILPNARIGHAHNIYLQFGVAFGIPVMILFIGLIVISAIKFAGGYLKNNSIADAAFLMFLLVPAVFGMLEYAWGDGSLTITMLFIVWRRMICNDQNKGK